MGDVRDCEDRHPAMGEAAVLGRLMIKPPAKPLQPWKARIPLRARSRRSGGLRKDPPFSFISGLFVLPGFAFGR
jgi:hypothetical protein